jgi:fucose permease
MKLSAKHTIAAGYVGYATQALVINFAPLLFITFEKSYNISISKIGLLIAISFFAQFSIDALAAKFSSRLNTRATVVSGHVCAALGMISFAILPDILPDHFSGLVIATVLAAIGGGVIEVFISPIIEACPTKEKSSAMSLLHSFYSWGSAATVLLSTLFFSMVGIEHWRILSCLWALLPAVGAIMFGLVPIYELDAGTDGSKEGSKSNSLLRSKLFWIFFIIMFCAGAAEMALSQWASSFAESGLGVDKTLGDLLGPCAFAIFMGTARVFYAFMGKRIKLTAFFTVSAILCTLSYLIAALSSIPMLSLLGCALCGLSVGIMWPGTYSLATERIDFGGVRMFALLALAGDTGCIVGPSIAGGVAELFGNNLQVSFLFSALFPIVILALIPLVILLGKKNKAKG